MGNEILILGVLFYYNLQTYILKECAYDNPLVPVPDPHRSRKPLPIDQSVGLPVFSLSSFPGE